MVDHADIPGTVDLDAERYVLGACVVWPEEIKVTQSILGDVVPWTQDNHRALWSALLKLDESGTPVLPSEIVKLTNRNEVMEPLIDSLVRNQIHSTELAHYAKKLLHLQRRRAVGFKAMALMDAAALGVVNGELDALKEACRLLDNDGEYKPESIPQTALELITSPIKPIHYALKPVIALGKLTQLQGEPKAGKSVFAFYMAMCMALGYWISGRFSIDANTKRRVLYLADEDAENLLQMRLRLFYKGLGVGDQSDLANLIVLTQEKCSEFDFDLTEERGRTGLVNLIKYTGAEVIFLDSLSNFCPVAEENSKKEMQPIMKFLKRTAINLGVAIIYLHHIAKPQNGVQRSRVAKGRGSGSIAAAWDVLIDWGDRQDSNVTPTAIVSKLGSVEGGTFDVIWSQDDRDNPTEVKWSIQDAMPTENSKAMMRKVMTALVEMVKTSPDGVKSKDLAVAVGTSDDNAVIYLKIAMNIDKVDRKQSDAKGKPWLYFPISD